MCGSSRKRAFRESFWAIPGYLQQQQQQLLLEFARGQLPARQWRFCQVNFCLLRLHLQSWEREWEVCVCVCVWERERKRVRWRDGERERRLTSSSSLTSSAEALNLYLLYTERRKQRYSESPEPRRSLEDGDEGYICCSTSRTVSIILNCINTIVYSTSLRLLLYKVLHALTNQYLRSRM